MLSAIMTSPDFAEVCFLVALILFVIAAVFGYARRTVTDQAYASGAIVAVALAFLALGFLAL